MVVLKTKGDQLDNLDTAYKRELLSVMSDAFAWDSTVPAGAKLPGYFEESTPH
jgi:type III restriction enzyme